MNKLIFEIGGEQRGFIIGLGFLGDMLNHFDTDIQGIGKMAINNNIFALCPTCVYYGHKHYCMSEKKPIDFTLYDVEQWLLDLENGMFNKNVQELLSLMTKTLTSHLGHLIGEEGKEKKN